MSQIIFDDLNPDVVSGTELAQHLNDFKDAVRSGFIGNSRPTNISAGGYFVDDTDSGTGYLSFKLYDGTKDIEMFKINTTTSTIVLGATEDSIELIKTSDDAVGPTISLEKERILGGTQTLENDILGDIDFKGNDTSSVDYVQARIRVVSTDDVSGTEQGSYMVFFTTAQDGTALVESMRITGDGNLGLGDSAPTKKISTSATTNSNAGQSHTLIEESASGVEEIIQKKRTLTNGQTVISDVIGKTTYKGVDEAGTSVDLAQVEIKTTETTSTTAQGSTVTIKNKKAGATAFSSPIIINDEVTIDRATTISAGGINVTGNSEVDGNLDVTGTLTVDTDVNITGKLTASETELGTITEIADPRITLNKGGTENSADTANAGFEVEMSDATDFRVGFDNDVTSELVAGRVGALKEIVNVDSVQDVTNKNISLSKFVSKTDTLSNLETYATTATNGEILYASDEKKYYGIEDLELVQIGGGGVGGSDIYGVLNADDDKATDWDVTGLTNASFGEETTLPLKGDTSFKLTNASGATGEILRSPLGEILVPIRSRGKLNAIRGQYNCTGTDSYIRGYLYDITNSAELGELYFKATTVSKQFVIFGELAADTAIVELRFEVMTGEAAELIFDDVEFTDDPLVSAAIQTAQQYMKYDTWAGLSSANTRIPYFTNITVPTNNTIYAVENSATTGFSITAKRACEVTMVFQGRYSGTGEIIGISKNGSNLSVGIDSLPSDEALVYISEGGRGDAAVARVTLAAGDVLRPHVSNVGATPINLWEVSATATAINDHILVSDTRQQAHFVGSASWAYNAGHNWTVSGASWSSFPSDTDALTPTVKGGITVADKNYPVVTGTGLKKGFYTVNFRGGMTFGGADAAFRVGCSNGEHASLAKIQVANTTVGTLSGTIEIFSDGDYTFEIQGYNAAEVVNNTAYQDDFTIEVTYLPPEDEKTVVTTVALPMSEKQSFTASIGNNGTASLIASNADWMAPPTRSALGTVVIDYTKLNLTTLPAIEATVFRSSGDKADATIIAKSLTSVIIKAFYNTSTAQDHPFDITLHKQGADATGEQTYIGSFRPKQLMYVRTSEVAYMTGFTTTTYAATPLSSLEGDIFGSLGSNQLTLPAGAYDFSVPIGADGATNWVYFGLHDGSSYILEEREVVYSIDSSISPTDVKFTLTFSTSKTLEFRGYSDTSGAGIYFGKITIEKRS